MSGECVGTGVSGVGLSWISWLCHLCHSAPCKDLGPSGHRHRGTRNQFPVLEEKPHPTSPHPTSLLRSYLIGCFRDGILPCSPCWPWTSDPSALPSQVLGFQECATMPAQMIILILVRGAGRDAGKHLAFFLIITTVDPSLIAKGPFIDFSRPVDTTKLEYE